MRAFSFGCITSDERFTTENDSDAYICLPFGRFALILPCFWMSLLVPALLDWTDTHDLYCHRDGERGHLDGCS